MTTFLACVGGGVLAAVALVLVLYLIGVIDITVEKQ